MKNVLKIQVSLPPMYILLQSFSVSSESKTKSVKSMFGKIVSHLSGFCNMWRIADTFGFQNST